MDAKHEIVCDLKRVATLLGHCPSRSEYRVHGQFSDRQIINSFKGSPTPFTDAIKAAGFTPKQQKKPKIKAAEFFKADPVTRLDAYRHAPKPLRFRTSDTFKDTLCIPDLHAPWVSDEVLCSIYELADRRAREGRPYRRVVQLGDARDRYADSKFPKSHLIYTPEQEDQEGTKVLSAMWSTLQRINPKDCEYYALLGNHDIRPYLRVAERSPDQMQFFDWAKFYALYEFPGIKLIRDSREELILDGMAFIHGYLSGSGRHRDHMNKIVIHGHTHKAFIAPRPLADRIIWEMDCGLAGDPKAKCMNFTPQKTNGWTLSFAEIDRDGPRIIFV